MSNYPRALDVSYCQPHIDYAKVAADGYPAVLAKCAERNFADPMWATHRKGFQDAGVQVHPYVFLCPGKVSAQVHYDTFHKAIMETGGFDGLGLPAMDFEGDANCSLSGMTEHEYRLMGLEWLDRLGADIGEGGMAQLQQTLVLPPRQP